MNCPGNAGTQSGSQSQHLIQSCVPVTGDKRHAVGNRLRDDQVIERIPVPLVKWQTIQSIKVPWRHSKQLYFACRCHLRRDRGDVSLQFSDPHLDHDLP
jgi:hypothetical protein